MKEEKILILGAGSIGSYLAAKLYSTGYHVDVIGRKAERIGNQLYINDKKYLFPSTSRQINNNTNYDVVLLTSKIYDLKKNLNLLTKSNIKVKIIVLLQNCFFDISDYNKSYEKNMISAIVNDGFNLNGNRLTYIRGKGFFIEEGKHGQRICSIFENAGIEQTKTQKITQQRAIKAIFNCSSNIFSAIYLKSYRELFKDKRITERIRNTYFEAYDILSRKVEFNQNKEYLWNNIYQRVKDMNHYPSTYQDVKANKITEISFLNGHIVRLGQEMNIATPYNSEAIKEFREKYPALY
ncbi:hypothetical protein BTJ40_10355 [Microbulbifer sp. A4B17]|uniref:ketopantoate reductase family protein n=1 Tax=Microbulbifer sp. A4B17 TaxID=359370 RepID=UPI000D52D534|nr:ketopantoate reductase C-terminal domain-containing protein [Microbulbifer sp. A4B17]AWF81187.1 hypothetical protein BTJ40_10355 [Microbulbifer sp. A4B17]